MRITKGKVIGGQIVLEGEKLAEGTTVTILVPEGRTFTLSEEEEAELLEAIAEADRDELLDAKDVLDRLPGPPVVSLPIKITRRADRQIREAGAWWVANRPAAPKALKEELQRAFDLVSERPAVGAQATNVIDGGWTAW